MTHTASADEKTAPPTPPDAARGRNVFLVFLVPSMTVLVALLVFLIFREERMAEQAQVSELKEIAEAFYEQIAVARSWNAKHGGVYVEATAETPPNPYLKVADRDMVSVDGRRFTKINPAYMTRQLSEITSRRHGYQFRIVGLRPENPANAADAWEAQALRRFENGAPGNQSAIATDDGGRRLFRFLVPLRIESPCLTCHARRGYRIGDIKGGVSIMIPTERFDAIRRHKTWKTIISLSLIVAAGIMLVTGITVAVSKRLSRELRKNIEQEKLAAVVELARATAHEMRQPMTVVHCVLGGSREGARRDAALTPTEREIIENQCERMDNFIERLLHITDYKTKEYLDGIRIIDVDASSAWKDKAE